MNERSLLFLSHRIPFPPDKGDKIRSYHVLRHLASKFRIRLGCFCDDRSDLKYLPRLGELCADVFCLPLSRSRKLLRAAGSFGSGVSFSEAIYHDAAMANWVGSQLADEEVGDIYVFCSSMAPYVTKRPRRKRVILDMVDVDSLKWGAYAKSVRWPLRVAYQREQRKLLDLERKAAMLCDVSLFVSDAESAAFARLAPESAGRLRSVENGVDDQYFDPRLSWVDPFPPGGSRVLFTGAMNYRPNVDAVSWFVRKVLPVVQTRHADVEFWIVGSNPSGDVRRLEREPGVRVTGGVPDIRPYLAHASCAVAPLRIARGVQNKVLEAMAMAKVVVASNEAAQGLDAIPGQHFLVADGAARFADCVGDVLDRRVESIGSAARVWIESECRWSDKLKVLDELILSREIAGMPTMASSPLLNAHAEISGRP